MEKTKSFIDCFIRSLYFGGTRSVRVINTIISFAWFIALMLHITTDLHVQLPKSIHGEPLPDGGNGFGGDVKILIIMSFISGVTAVGSLTLKKHRHCLKYVSLHAGALTQALISAAYTAYYPPLAMTAVTSIIMALWFLGAAYFVMEEPSTQGDSNALRRNSRRVG